MTDHLTSALDGLGYGPRLPQRTLFDELLANEQLVAQAGTGVGKSIAILAAALHRREESGFPSVVVVPTNVLMGQYAEKDGPAFEQATGAVVRALKGRSHYLCDQGPGFFLQEPGHERYAALINEPDIVQVNSETAAFGCPGFELCSGDAESCHYIRARTALRDADIIITNAHIYIIEMGFTESRQHKDCGLDALIPRSCECGPRILPDFGAVFVDEAHTLEGVVRDFQGVTISLPVVTTMGHYGEPMADWLRQFTGKDPVRILPEASLGQALVALSEWQVPDGDQKGHKLRIAAAEAAEKMLTIGRRGGFTDNASVAWVEPGPPEYGGRTRRTKLVAMPVTVGGTTGPMLRKHPFALVSATVPGTMGANLGVAGTRFVDVGHPFNYASQGSLAVSPHSGDYRSNKTNLAARAHELRDRILARGGGALVLFSSYANLEAVHGEIAKDLRAAGLTVLRQERESDKRALGEAFKVDGNAVLFGAKSFATGFDAPGDALRLVGIWNLPYPAQTPLVAAIKDRSYAAYEDMMLVEVTQAIGRLIRTEEDQGEVWIGDARAHRIIGRADPMVAHLREFARVPNPSAGAGDSLPMWGL